MIAVGAALLSALLTALGFVVQQHIASQAPESEQLSLRLIVDLARRPAWLGGILLMIAGMVFSTIALGRGSLALVEPLGATNLLFALPLAARWRRARMLRSDWIGVCLLIGGLAGFLAAGNPPSTVTTNVSRLGWVFAGAAVGTVALAVVAYGRRRRPAIRAGLFAAGAGILYGLQDATTQHAFALSHRGVWHLLHMWPPYAVAAIGLFGLVITQSAFEAAPLAASLPALAVLEPVTGVALGQFLFSQHLRVTPFTLGVQAVSAVAMVVGVVMIARSPLVDPNAPLRPARLRTAGRPGTAAPPR